MKTSNLSDTGGASAAAEAERLVIPVSGMTCAACQSRVQRTLNEAPGVVDASVNLMMGNATVAFDPSTTTREALVDTIRSTGYGAELPLEEQSAFDEQETRDRAQDEEFRDLRRKAIISGIIGAVAETKRNQRLLDRVIRFTEPVKPRVRQQILSHREPIPQARRLGQQADPRPQAFGVAPFDAMTGQVDFAS